MDNTNRQNQVFNVSEAAELIASKLTANEEIILDIFGGKVSQVKNAINFDLIAEQGIRASVKDLLNIFPPNSVSEIVASGPQDAFLEESAKILKIGGRIYINATKGNPFGKVPDSATKNKLGEDALEILGLRVIQTLNELAPRFAKQKFFRTDGYEIPIKSIKTTILEKINDNYQESF